MVLYCAPIMLWAQTSLILTATGFVYKCVRTPKGNIVSVSVFYRDPIMDRYSTFHNHYTISLPFFHSLCRFVLKEKKLYSFTQDSFQSFAGFHQIITSLKGKLSCITQSRLFWYDWNKWLLSIMLAFGQKDFATCSEQWIWGWNHSSQLTCTVGDQCLTVTNDLQ